MVSTRKEALAAQSPSHQIIVKVLSLLQATRVMLFFSLAYHTARIGNQTNMNRAGAINQVWNVTRVESHRCLAMGKTRENGYYRLGPYPRSDLSSPSSHQSCSLDLLTFPHPACSQSCSLDPLRRGTRGQRIASYDSHTSPCPTTSLSIRPSRQ